MVLVCIYVTPAGVKQAVVKGNMSEELEAAAFYRELKPLLERMDEDIKRLGRSEQVSGLWTGENQSN